MAPVELRSTHWNSLEFYSLERIQITDEFAYSHAVSYIRWSYAFTWSWKVRKLVADFEVMQIGRNYGPSGDALAAFFATGIRSSTGSAKSLGLTVETHVQGFVCCRCRKETKSPSTWMLLVASLICSCFFSLSPCFYAFGLINDSLYISSSHPYGADFFCQAIALVRSLVCTLFNCLKAMKSPSRCGKKTQSWSRNILSNLGKMKKLY